MPSYIICQLIFFFKKVHSILHPMGFLVNALTWSFKARLGLSLHPAEYRKWMGIGCLFDVSNQSWQDCLWISDQKKKEKTKDTFSWFSCCFWAIRKVPLLPVSQQVSPRDRASLVLWGKSEEGGVVILLLWFNFCIWPFLVKMAQKE